MCEKKSVTRSTVVDKDFGRVPHTFVLTLFYDSLNLVGETQAVNCATTLNECYQNGTETNAAKFITHF